MFDSNVESISKIKLLLAICKLADLCLACSAAGSVSLVLERQSGLVILLRRHVDTAVLNILNQRHCILGKCMFLQIKIIKNVFWVIDISVYHRSYWSLYDRLFWSMCHRSYWSVRRRSVCHRSYFPMWHRPYFHMWYRSYFHVWHRLYFPVWYRSYFPLRHRLYFLCDIYYSPVWHRSYFPVWHRSYFHVWHRSYFPVWQIIFPCVT